MKIDNIKIRWKKELIEVKIRSIFAKINKKLSVVAVLYKTNANYKKEKQKQNKQNEVKGSTSKIYAQKGTGNARHASKKAPIFCWWWNSSWTKREFVIKKEN